MQFFTFVLAALTLSSAAASPIENPAVGVTVQIKQARGTTANDTLAGESSVTSDDFVIRGDPGYKTNWAMGFCRGKDLAEDCYFFDAPANQCVKVGNGYFTSKSFTIVGDIPCNLYQTDACYGQTYQVTGPVEQNSGWTVIGSFRCFA
ncbi:hypothetical protein DFH06DRAFT_1196646 [Mycena polygramma]|nr:hypothetical protein DFH06DRAFT_1218239 [Mycena polygramma]KAJ7658326.1 hypothetical protein DFH06DRAFT_1196646 [Mycena polygramma]